MPIYAYRCESCGHAKDVLRKVSDPVLSTCPACGAESFKKQLTAAGFQLKGSGWYVTDFRGNGNGAAKGDAKSDTKTDAKTEPTPDAPKSEPAASASTGTAASSGGDSAPAGGCGTSCACH